MAVKRLLPLALLVMSCRSASSSAPARTSGTSVATTAAPAARATPPAVEGDYHGTFNGIELYASLDACSANHEVRGTLFYARIGVPIDVAGTCNDTALTFRERSGNKDVSTITLRYDGGAWTGDWQDDKHRGAARLDPIRRAPGGPVVVAKRHQRVTPTGAQCPIEVDVPTPLGLSDRTFQRRLQDELKIAATTRLDATYVCGEPVSVTYEVHQPGKGLFGVVFRFAYNMGAPTDRAWAISVATDQGIIAKELDEIADSKRVRPALRGVIDKSGWNPTKCAAWEDGAGDGTWDALNGARGAAVGERGLVVCRPRCDNHAHSYACYDVPYATLGLHAPFDGLLTNN